jgi:hypothetical protein
MSAMNVTTDRRVPNAFQTDLYLPQLDNVLRHVNQINTQMILQAYALIVIQHVQHVLGL